MANIKLIADVGPAFVKLVENTTIDIDVNDIIVNESVDKSIMPTIAVFNPHTKNIALDMARILKAPMLRNRGMMFLPSFWYNLLWVYFHELCHADQFMKDPSIIKYFNSELPIRYEKEANEFAADNIFNWLRSNKIPPITKLGWIGKRIEDYVNKFYSLNPRVADELDWMEAGAVMNIYDVIELQDLDDDGKMELMEMIEDEKCGIKIDKETFITAPVFFGLYEEFHDKACDETQNRVCKTAQQVA